jgi:hypothetical protein
LAKDMLGNEIKEGDFVRIDPPAHVFGRIIKITHGGAIIGHVANPQAHGKPIAQVSPGIVTVEIIYQTTYDPNLDICTKVVKCQDPSPEEEKKPSLVV